jgi:glycosyltransferase involved in cell wall biosynthesis
MISVFHPSLAKIAGAERVCLDIIDTISKSHDVKLFLVDSEIDEEVESKLINQGIEIEILSFAHALSAIGIGITFIRLVANVELLLSKSGRRIVSTKGFLFIPVKHDIYLHDPERIWKTKSSSYIFTYIFWAIKIYVHVIHRLYNVRIFVNSHWTFDQITDQGFKPDAVIYPKVPNSPIEGEYRVGPRLVTVGRFVESKRLIPIINVVADIVQDYPEIRLTIAGFGGDSEYEHEIRMFDSKYDWLDVKLNVSNDSLLHIYQKSDIYIHGKKFEHYGISIAEAILNGCVSFVHNSGGQKEILSNKSDYIYEDDSDLEIKLRKYLSNNLECVYQDDFNQIKNQLVDRNRNFQNLVEKYLITNTNE